VAAITAGPAEAPTSAAASGQGLVRSATIPLMRSRQVPQPVQAPVARDTALTVTAPLSIAVVTSSLVTARQMQANTPSPVLSRGVNFGKAILTFAARKGKISRRATAAGIAKSVSLILGFMASEAAVSKVAVIGGGAIGGVLAEAACAAGHEVTVCVRTPFAGLTVQRAEAARELPAAIAADPEADAVKGPADWVLLTTKAYQIPGAAPWLARLCGPRTVTVVVQNGVDHAERVAPFGLTGPVLPALAYISARRDGPGRVRHVFGERVVVPEGQAGARFAALLAGSPVAVEQSADFRTEAWRKLLVNVAANPVTALTGRPMAVLGEPGIPPLVHGLLSEAVAAATASGARLSAGDVTATMDFYDRLGDEMGTSMLEDRLAGRPTEHDEITGAVVRAADRHGVDVPLNRTLLALLAAASPV
jgi:2-dehydropantoate 2-reductase